MMGRSRLVSISVIIIFIETIILHSYKSHTNPTQTHSKTARQIFFISLPNRIAGATSWR